MSDEFIDRDQWKAFCARVSRQLEGAQAEVEVASLGLGDQLETEWVGLVGITYDPKEDVLDVALDGVGHIVREPISLAVAWSGATISSLAVETPLPSLRHNSGRSVPLKPLGV